MKTIRHFIFSLLCFFTLSSGFAQGEFITVWDLSLHTGTGANQISFSAAIAFGGANYSWQSIPAGNSGSGTLAAGTGTRVISGIPAGAKIRLQIQPNNLQRFHNNFLTDEKRLIDVEQWGTAHWLSMEEAFQYCNNLQISASDVPDLSSVTSMRYMFFACTNLNSPSNINSWNTSSVTNMFGLFYLATAFNQDLGNWNTSSVTNLGAMFYGAAAFNQNIGNWNTSASTNMAGMFREAVSFNQNLNSWNTSSVNNMSQMFFGASSFNQALDLWNTGAVTSMNSMFFGANSFNQFIGNWNTSSVTNMFQMFFGTTAFNQNIGNWNVSLVTNMASMFANAQTFNQNIGAWNTEMVTNMQGMFANAYAFNQDIGSWNTSSVTSIAGMFSNAYAFNQNIENWTVDYVTQMAYMFSNALSFNQSLGNWHLNPSVDLNSTLYNCGMDCDSYSETLIGWAQNSPNVYNRELWAQNLNFRPYALSARNQLLNQGWTIYDSGQNAYCNGMKTIWNLSNPGANPNEITFNAEVVSLGAEYYWETIPAGTSGTGTLVAGNSSRTISGIPTGATIRLIIKPDNLKRFYINTGPDRLRLVDVEQWGTSTWTSMETAFRSCSNLNISATDIPNLSYVQNTANMFMGCTQLNGPSNIGAWDMSNVMTLTYMFRSASAFNQDLSAWNMQNALNLFGMFRTASSFNQNLGNWSFSNAANLEEMLSSCGMDCSNYSATLTGWLDNNPTALNRNLGAAGLNYSHTGIAARNALINAKGWSIFDNGVSNCGAFITKWDMTLNTGTGPNRIMFYANVASGGANYYWETIPAGTSGSGVLASNQLIHEILGIPTGSTIRLYIEPKNLKHFYFDLAYDRLRLFDVEQWGSANWLSMNKAFYNCSNLNVSAIDVPNLTNANDMKEMFRGCSSLNGPNNIGSWNTSNVVNMSYVFYNASSFNQAIDSWNTSSVIDMGYMFHGAISFNQALGSWNTSNVQWMSSMFAGAASFNQDISGWNTQSALDMVHMFISATSFNQDLILWNVQNSNSVAGMFNGASSFNQDLGNWVFKPSVNLTDLLKNSGLNCDNYSSTLIGWAQNNPLLNNKNIGDLNLIYNSSSISSRNQLINQGWTFFGDLLAGTNPYLALPNALMNAVNDCEPFLSQSDFQYKLLTINPNGNTVNYNNMSATVRNAFVASIPSGITTVSSANSGYYNIDNGSTNVFRISRRMFTIQSPDVYPDNGGVLVRVYYHPDDFSSMINDPAPVPINDFGWYKSSSHIPQDIVNEMSLNEPMLASAIIIEDVTYGVENGVNYAEFLVESFSTFGMYAKHKFGPLPVTLTSFNANCQGETIQLNWSTASEYNAAHYIIQNSRNGFTWTDLGEVAAAGTTNQATNYSFETKNFGGLNYFRLVQVDLDGASEIFGPVITNCELENSSMTVYPNPTAENFSVRIETKESIENATVELIDNMGRVVLSRTLNIEAGTTTIPFENRDLQAGAYILRLRCEGEKFKPVQVVRM